MWLQHLTRSYNSSGLRESMSEASPAKEGGELVLPDGSIIEYNDYESCAFAANAVKKFEKDALLEEQQNNKLEGNLRDTRSRYGDPKEWHSVSLNFSKEESEIMTQNDFEAARSALKETIEDVARENGGRVSYFIDNVHTDRDHAHIQARIHKIPIDLENKKIGNQFDLIKASDASNFADKFREKLAKKLGAEAEQLNRINFNAPSGAEINVESARAGNLLKEPDEYRKSIKFEQQKEPEPTIKQDRKFSVELVRLANLERESEKELNGIDAQIQQLIRQKELAETRLNDAQHAKQAVKEREEAIFQKEEIQKELIAVKEQLDYSSSQIKNKDIEINHNELKIENLEKFLELEKQQVFELENTVEQFLDKNNQLSSQVFELNENLTKTVLERDELQSEIDEQRELIGAYEFENTDLKSELKSSEKTIESLINKNTELTVKLEDLSLENESLKTDKSALESESVKLNKEIEKAEKTIELLSGKNTELTTKLEDLSLDNESLKTDKSALEFESVKLNKEIEEAEKTIESLSDKNTRLNETVSELNNEKSELKTENVQLKKQLKGLERQMQEMQSQMMSDRREAMQMQAAMMEQMQKMQTAFSEQIASLRQPFQPEEKEELQPEEKEELQPEEKEELEAGALSKDDEAAILRALDEQQEKADKEKSGKSKQNNNENDR